MNNLLFNHRHNAVFLPKGNEQLCRKKNSMVERPTPAIRQLRTRLLPELIYIAAFPYLIFRLASPYMPATYALLLAGIPPAIRLAFGLLRQRRIDLLGMFSLLAIVIGIFSGLVLKDTRLQLVSGSLVTGVYGVLMLASLLTPRPLILRLAESALGGNNPAQRESVPLQESRGLVSFAHGRHSFSIRSLDWNSLCLDCLQNGLTFQSFTCN